MTVYATVDELSDYLNIGDSIEDDSLSLALSAASSIIDRWCGQTFGDDDAEIPEAVKLACLIQATRLYKRKDAPAGIGGSAEFNGGAVVPFRPLPDADVIVLLDAYKKRWIAV